MMKLIYENILFIFLFFLYKIGYCLSNGNFSLPVSQQPGPFISFGQNIIDKNQKQVFFTPLYQNFTDNRHYSSFEANYLYALSNKSSVLFTLPVAVEFQNHNHNSSSIQDISLQGEYAFLDKEHTKYQETATIVGAVSLPTGDALKNPPTGYGGVSYFLGTTYNITYEKYLAFISYGLLYITPNHHAYRGKQYIYQAGIGKNIATKKNTYLWNILIEFNGLYSEKNRLFGIIENNSGGNLILLTPSINYANKKFTFQAGFSIPILQNLNGIQPQSNYNLISSITYTI